VRAKAQLIARFSHKQDLELPISDLESRDREPSASYSRVRSASCWQERSGYGFLSGYI